MSSTEQSSPAEELRTAAEPSTASNLALNPANAASPFDFTPCPECAALVLVDNTEQHAAWHAVLSARLRSLAAAVRGWEA